MSVFCVLLLIELFNISKVVHFSRRILFKYPIRILQNNSVHEVKTVTWSIYTVVELVTLYIKELCLLQ